MNKKFRLFIASDHPLVRAGVQYSFRNNKKMHVDGPAGGVHEIFREVERVQPDIVILDLPMKGSEGLALIRKIRRISVRIPILVITSQSNAVCLAHALEAGAKGFLPKNFASPELTEAIQVVIHGGLYIKPSILGALLGKHVPDKMHPPASSAKSFCHTQEILSLIQDGFEDREIAKTLGLHIRKVESFRNKLNKKQSSSPSDSAQFPRAKEQ